MLLALPFLHLISALCLTLIRNRTVRSSTSTWTAFLDGRVPYSSFTAKARVLCVPPSNDAHASSDTCVEQRFARAVPCLCGPPVLCLDVSTHRPLHPPHSPSAQCLLKASSASYFRVTSSSLRVGSSAAPKQPCVWFSYALSPFPTAHAPVHRIVLDIAPQAGRSPPSHSSSAARGPLHASWLERRWSGVAAVAVAAAAR
ncbi:hypothetical protein C8R45DRAFT_1102081 [Mycena sanguinolenta]|nr:hypothetical protein C8R45DRAFT_1102081 [Mycena sanguinolenta]